MAARVEVDRVKVADLIGSTIGPAAIDLERRLIRVQNDAKRRCPVNFGRLRGSITHEIVGSRGQLVGRVGTNVDYALPVHEGRKEVVPVTKKVLRWPVGRRGPPWVFSMRSKAVKGRPFLKDALPAGGGRSTI